MGEGVPNPFSRGDALERTRQDVQRRRRGRSGANLWHSIALIGSVGWPIALLTTGGALLGHALDRHYHSGLRFTLILLTLGVTLGTVAALRSIQATHP